MAALKKSTRLHLADTPDRTVCPWGVVIIVLVEAGGSLIYAIAVKNSHEVAMAGTNARNAWPEVGVGGTKVEKQSQRKEASDQFEHTPFL